MFALGFVGRGGRAANSPEGRYWKLTNDAGLNNRWELNSTSASDAGVFESSDLTGTDIGAGLNPPDGPAPLQIAMRLADGSSTVETASVDGNPFDGEDLYSLDTSVADFWMDFGEGRMIRSMHYRAGSSLRSPTSMGLYHSADNITWTLHATLTNDSRHTTPFWRSIVEGGTIAATGS
ncbi:MAG: hypothetical protein AAF234_15915 [Pseudomonadota bacterium]